MLNASVGIQRVLGRVRRPPYRRADSAQRRSLNPVPRVRRGLLAVIAASRLGPARQVRVGTERADVRTDHKTGTGRRSLIGRLGPDRAVAVAVASVLLGASVVSVSAGLPGGATGGTNGDGPAPRIAVGGGADKAPNDTDQTGSVEFGDPEAEAATTLQPGFAAIDFADRATGVTGPTAVEGPFIDDGTLIKPVAVDTTVPDGSALVKTYLVKAGDTLAGIAAKFGVSTMSVWWANDLKSKDVRKGQTLRIPPVTGLIVRVATTDTLDLIAARYSVNSSDILVTNGLTDRNLVVGQVLVIPGAKGKAIPVTRPTAKVPRSGSSGIAGSVRPPARYTGGKFLWPVAGGGNYISQYYRYGHYAIDVAADYGSTVRAAAAGTVIFAGWKSNGGGYQVWVAHGSGLYSTYNHLSGVSVGRGQQVARGARVGRVGQSGNASGPHLHFEVWRGPVWNGGQRVNPLGYL